MVGRGLGCLVAAMILAQPLRAEGVGDAGQRYAERSVAALDADAGIRAGAPALYDRFESLSAGNRQIALAFYYAQDTDGDPGRIWSLDRIAAQKLAGSAWAEIHARLQRDGAIGDVTLGRILSRSVKAGRRGLAAARARDAALMGLSGLAPKAVPGAFKSLSAGNRKIAEALFNSQSIGPAGLQAWSLDQIAMAKGKGAGWNRILAQLRADGLIVETGLGPILAKHRRDLRRSAIPTQIVVLDGRGRRMVVGGHP